MLALKILSYSPSVDLDVVQAFFNAGAYPNQTNYNGCTILELAAKNNWSKKNYLSLVNMCVATQKLVAKDFSYAFRCYLSYSPSIDLDVVQAFFNAGAYPNQTNYNGYTILELAAKNRWSTDSYSRLIQIVTKASTVSLNEGKSEAVKKLASPKIEERNSAEKVFALLQSGKINSKNITSLAKEKFSKEKLISYINTRPEVEKQEILKSAFDENSNLNRFFSAQRGWLPTSMNRGSFKTLKEMKQVPSSATLVPYKAVQFNAFKASNDSMTFWGSPPQTKEPTNGFSCPITLGIMQDPVLCTLDGNSYERSAITQWLTQSRITPTRVQMSCAQSVEDVLVPNRSLAKAIGQYAKENPGLFATSQSQYSM